MKKMNRGILAKFIAIGVIVIVLLIGLACIKGKSNDRKYEHDKAVDKIVEAAGGPLIINGFLIEVPYKETYTKEVWQNNQMHTEKVVDRGAVTLEPEELIVNSKLKTEKRTLGIYSTPIFSGKIQVKSQFNMDLVNSGIREYDFKKAKVYLYVSEKSLSSRPIFTVNDAKYRTECEKASAVNAYNTEKYRSSTVPMSAVIKTGIPSQKGALVISTELDIVGASNFNVFPAKGSTSLDVECDWPSPDFTQSWQLPTTRTLTENGFTASWFIPFTSGKSDNLIGFSYTDPMNVYAVMKRAITYGFLFIIIPFIVFFLFEIFAKVNFHPVHYSLSGAACVLFFLLLLSISEHISFTASYWIAAGAVSVMVSFYTGSVSRKWRTGLAMFPMFACLYGFMFVCLNSEDYALLIGSIFLFLIIAVTMFCTRKVDWAKIGKEDR